MQDVIDADDARGRMVFQRTHVRVRNRARTNDCHPKPFSHCVSSVDRGVAGHPAPRVTFSSYRPEHQRTPFMTARRTSAW